MASLSLAFHIASAFGLLIMLLALGKLRTRIEFLRRWLHPANAGILVGHSFATLKNFADALDIPITYPVIPTPPVRVSLTGLFSLHRQAGICSIRIKTADSKPNVVFVVRKSFDTIVEELKTIESEFGHTFITSWEEQP